MTIQAEIEQLFSDARNRNALQYVFTLVRVDGITDGLDPLLKLSRTIQNADADQVREADMLPKFCEISSAHEPFALLANLLNCSADKPYHVSPFGHLNSGNWPNIQFPTNRQVVAEMGEMLTTSQRHCLKELFDLAYPDEILRACEEQAPEYNPELTKDTLVSCFHFLRALLAKHVHERRRYLQEARFYKLPGFQVLEILTNESDGLFGFQMHFSNGTTAGFQRYPDHTECPNISDLGPPLGFMAGDLDSMREEWRVGERRLSEIGLKGRYNKLGEWKPLIFPGSIDAFLAETKELTEDTTVQGILLHILTTCYWTIEFVVRTTVDLPSEYTSIGEKFHLWRCPPRDPTQDRGFRVYDGWLDLDSAEPGRIRSALAEIGLTLNRLFFAYRGRFVWRAKYTTIAPAVGIARLSDHDLEYVNSMLKEFPAAENAVLLDSAIEWYNRGTSSNNPVDQFFCYFVSVESVAIAIANGRANLGLGISKEDKKTRRERMTKCIEEKYNSLYATNPVRFVQDANSECIQGLRSKMRSVIESVFGANHEHLKRIFDKKDGHSLYDIRHKIAHGSVTLLNQDDEHLVRLRIPEIASIAHEFLCRLIFRLTPSEPLPSWSGRFSASIQFSDPRNLLYATREDGLPSSDWQIRPEWCDPE